MGARPESCVLMKLQRTSNSAPLPQATYLLSRGSCQNSAQFKCHQWSGPVRWPSPTGSSGPQVRMRRFCQPSFQDPLSRKASPSQRLCPRVSCVAVTRFRFADTRAFTLYPTNAGERCKCGAHAAAPTPGLAGEDFGEAPARQGAPRAVLPTPATQSISERGRNRGAPKSPTL